MARDGDEKGDFRVLSTGNLLQEVADLRDFYPDNVLLIDDSPYKVTPPLPLVAARADALLPASRPPLPPSLPSVVFFLIFR